MRVKSLVFLLFACILPLGVRQARGVEGEEQLSTVKRPCWIWHRQDRQPGQSARFTKSFFVPQDVTAAVIRCGGESAGLVVSLNDQKIGQLEPYDPIAQMDVTHLIRPGQHQLAVHASSVEGPSAFFLALEIRLAVGVSFEIHSDQTWQATSQQSTGEAVEFGAVDERFLIPRDRQMGIKATDNYEQWKQALGAEAGTDPASFMIADGFEVQLVRSAAADEDSWVSMAVDQKGRVLIAKESKGLLRMTLSPAGDRVTNTELVNDSLKECRGILPVGRDLFVNANNSKALFRLRTGSDDGYGEPELIFASAGSVGHGRNDLALGNDGKIYSIHGDAVELPAVATDYTSPFCDRQANQGHLLRIDPATGSVELLATGLRNPFGIDFNADGDIFTYDADAEYDMGSPWYRPTRVNHLVTGGDYGWRAVTKSWPPYHPDHADNARPNLDIGKGSPTAVKFGTRSSFPRRFRQALFILDWAYGRIIAVHAMPRGASYVMTAETFLKGRPLNVTDLDFAADGSMYFVTGGRKTRSSLYRVRFVGQQRKQSSETDQQKSRFEFAAQSRRLRHELEDQLLRDPLLISVPDLFAHLNDADPWIRQAAINVLERLEVESWAKRALAETSVSAALRSLLSLARSKQPEHNAAIVGRLNQLPIADASRSDKLAALQAYALCLDHGVTAADVLETTRKKLDACYPDDSYPVNRLLSELLVQLGSDSVVVKTIDLLRHSRDQTEQMHCLYVLRNVDHGWTLDARRDYFAALSAADHYLGGAGMPDFLKRIRGEALDTLTDEEQAALAAVIEARSQPELTQPDPPREFVRKWTVDAVMALNKSDHQIDVARGKELFRKVSCSRCHRLSGFGTLIGPDLTNVSSRFSRRDLLRSIIEPSKVIAENYQSLQIVTTDGKVLVGQIDLGWPPDQCKVSYRNDDDDPDENPCKFRLHVSLRHELGFGLPI